MSRHQPVHLFKWPLEFGAAYVTKKAAYATNWSSLSYNSEQLMVQKKQLMLQPIDMHPTLNIDVPSLKSMVLNKSLTRFYLIPHENREYLVSAD